MVEIRVYADNVKRLGIDYLHQQEYCENLDIHIHPDRERRNSYFLIQEVYALMEQHYGMIDKGMVEACNEHGEIFI